MTDNFTELKRLFELEYRLIEERTTDRREAIARALIKLLDGFSIRETESFFTTASRLVCRSSYNAKIRADNF